MRGRPTYDDDVRARIPSDWRDTLEEIAYERSEPGNKVDVSQLVREALENTYDDLEEPESTD